MIKKRLIGVIVVQSKLAVQSFSYERYLPLGDPEILAQNLDRWGVDEILIQVIDRSRNELGPDYDLIKSIGRLGLSTPVIYGGGIREVKDAVNVIGLGADRVLIDSMLCPNSDLIPSLSYEVGAQAIIAHMPLRAEGSSVYWLNYKNGTERLLSSESISQINFEHISEIMLTDWQHEGVANQFDYEIVDNFPLADKPLIVFGGISEPVQMENLFRRNEVVGVGVGNFLNYKEHAIQLLRKNIQSAPIRSEFYSSEVYF